MKLCRYWNPRRGPVIGLVRDDRVFNLSLAHPQHFKSFSGLLADEALPATVEATAARASTQPSLSFSEIDIAPDLSRPHLLPPITRQEVWAAGVTYLRSREARMEESEQASSFYDKVYYASRPELFLKATSSRVVGPNGKIRIRKDSAWNVPEPEIALIVNPNGKLVAFTIGNDVSSRDIEGENPLYLPQAKVYAGSCALGPTFLLVQSVPDVQKLEIQLLIRRDGQVAFEGSTSVRQMKRGFEELISYLCREQEFPHGVILLTGTGIVPPDDFTLRSGDLVEITVPEIGTLRNPVA